ncbi:hypothetical protein NGC89_02955 [Staphylococcus xylosus]|uniref:hypothetical protein n=1 Tax=Staphylococcus xylosus TaxID=1288 RepID=UPI002DBF7F33|nr:hypothetical protein [Staphylococcus xylosus]MEB7800426.1 hypothetical protein [Staphylococcus xylosus]
MSFIATTDMYIEMRNKRDLAEDKLHDMTKQRDSLIDDIAVLKANISRLERENEKYGEHIGELQSQQGSREYTKVLEKENLEYFKENKVLCLQADKYTTLTNHIRLKAEINPSVDRYIDLVNYIDRLERVNDEKI